jgi:hypothetical protein
MNIPDINNLLESKALISILSLVAGGFVGNLIAALRNRVKTLEYTVTHDRVGLSADDVIFGSIRVTWQNKDVTNLYSSRVILENKTEKDFSNLEIKVYTGDTLLLSERTEVENTTHVLKWTNNFHTLLRVEPGQHPTEQQFDTYHHSREYIVPVLNRRQKVIMTYLTTVPSGTTNPLIWLDMLHKGVRVQFRPLVQQIHGVPVRIALSIGFVACLTTLIITSLLITESWAAASICMVFGLFAQSVGAFIYRGLRFLKTLIFH